MKYAERKERGKREVEMVYLDCGRIDAGCVWFGIRGLVEFWIFWLKSYGIRACVHTISYSYMKVILTLTFHVWRKILFRKKLTISKEKFSILHDEPNIYIYKKIIFSIFIKTWSKCSHHARPTTQTNFGILIRVR